MIEWPSSLVSDFARRRTVVVIGSGVSRHSVGKNGERPPTWKSFLETARVKCPDKSSDSVIETAINNGDYLHACEWLKKRFDEGWPTHLREVFTIPSYAPDKIHQELLKLDARIVFTLNFDGIYETYVNSVHNGSHVIKNFHDKDVAEFLRGDGRYIVKVHGNLNTPNNLIFTQQDYSRARVANSAFYQAFDAALLTHTFVFVGTGHSDPDVNLLLENQNFWFPTSSPHYMLCNKGLSNETKESLRTNRNLKVLEYDAKDEFHIGLLEALTQLNEKIEAQRIDIAQSTNW
jgi:hypothetical protein